MASFDPPGQAVSVAACLGDGVAGHGQRRLEGRDSGGVQGCYEAQVPPGLGQRRVPDLLEGEDSAAGGDLPVAADQPFGQEPRLVD